MGKQLCRWFRTNAVTLDFCRNGYAFVCYVCNDSSESASALLSTDKYRSLELALGCEGVWH